MFFIWLSPGNHQEFSAGPNVTNPEELIAGRSYVKKRP